MRLIISRESFLNFPISSTLYALHGRLGDACGGRMIDVVALALDRGVDVGGEG